VLARDGGQVWALRLEGKTDQEKFKELGWGLRTWDQWNFNECLPREIPGDSEAYFTGVYPVKLTSVTAKRISLG
jgi:hypothetical protein